jgi:hypothetical protein
MVGTTTIYASSFTDNWPGPYLLPKELGFSSRSNFKTRLFVLDKGMSWQIPGTIVQM